VVEESHGRSNHPSASSTAASADHAGRLLDEALAAYRTIGMPRHVAMSEELLQRL
jgi:hypothetical protein